MIGGKYETVEEFRAELEEVWKCPVKIKGRDHYGDEACPKCGEGGFWQAWRRGLLIESVSIELPPDSEHRDTREHHIHYHLQ